MMMREEQTVSSLINSTSALKDAASFSQRNEMLQQVTNMEAEPTSRPRLGALKQIESWMIDDPMFFKTKYITY